MGERTPLLRAESAPPADSNPPTESYSRSESLSRTTSNLGPGYGALSLILEGTSVSQSPPRTLTLEVPVGNGRVPRAS